MGIIVGNGIVFEHGAYRKLSNEERVKNVKAEEAAGGVKETEKAEEKPDEPLDEGEDPEKAGAEAVDGGENPDEGKESTPDEGKEDGTGKAEEAADGVKETEKAEKKNISPKAVIDGSQIVVGKGKKDTKKGLTKKDK
jgi:hypothetical protein